uniref:Uncharacterized protein n=1 Tax=Arundo donax TaxID=35708 RepID=A0A0A9HLY1_ARUDO
MRRAMPKSATRASMWASRSTLLDFMSRWMMCGMQLWCRKHSPRAAPRATRFRRSHGSWSPIFCWCRASSRLPWVMYSYTSSRSSPTLQ